ncbi:MAG TPA: MerR family transcriptional regulator [Candidatus Limnocylindrales bacterium]|nr:MerR family transcriptional regulator [Candidatus Limnocylindrales bacterium]
MVRLLIEDVTLTKTDQIHAHIRLRGGQTRSLTLPIPGKAWQIRQTKPETLAALNQLLNDHTDSETAQLLNAAGHQSGTGQPFTSSIVLHLRRSNGLPNRYERLRAKGLLTINQLARHLHVHPSTIKAWHRAGLLVSHKATDKNERLFEIPARGDKRLIARQGSPLRNRKPIQPTQRGAV